MRGSPAFVIVAVSTFALGIGVTMAIFAAVNGILFRPLPYADPSSLHRIEVNTGGEGWYGSSVPEYLDFETDLRAWQAIGAYNAGEVTLGDTLSPHRAEAAFVTASLLPMLGVEPAMGRFFTEAEDLPSNASYVVLSWELWQNDYAGDPAVLDATVPLFGTAYTVVGIMPRGFSFPSPDTRAWFPLAINRANPNLRNNHFLNVVGRLTDGASPAVAASELNAYTERARIGYPEIYSERGFRTRVISLHESVVGEIRTPLIVLLGAVALVLLIACANVANLLLTRGETRRRELAVRAAMGASQGRLIRQLVTESLLLAAAGGAAGLMVAAVVLRGLVALAPGTVPRLDMVTLGGAPIALATIVVMLAGILFGAVPAFRATRGGARGALVRGGRGVVARRSSSRARRWLVVSQIAFAGIITIATGVMIRTLGNLERVDTGFEPQGVLTLSISPPFNRYQQPDQRIVFWRQVLDRLAAVSGVEAVGAVSVMPLSDLYNNLSLRVEGRVTTSIGDAPDGRVQYVTPGLADALGLRVLRGRFFTAADGPDSQPVVVVSETFANTFWPGQDPIGKTMKVFSEDYPWMTVIGVVADLKHDGLDQPAAPMWYVPTIQSATTAYGTPLQMFAVLRTAAPPASLVPAVRAAIAQVDRTAPISGVASLEGLVSESVSGRRFTTRLLESFGLLALLLACIGVYGVTALAVAERRGEIGLRKALGAGSASIAHLIARENVGVAAMGAGFGIAGGLIATRLMQSLLFGVGMVDPGTVVATLFVLALTVATAAAVPAWRAMRTEALVTLREEV